MSDFDLERLGEMWREPPDSSQLEWMQRTAADVRRDARRSQALDIAAAALVSGAVILLVLLNPAVQTLAAGAGAILVLLASHIRQRRLRRIELQSLTGSTEEMLDQAIERAQASLKRARFNLYLLPPSLLIGVFFASTVEEAGGKLLPRNAGPEMQVMIWAALAAILLFLLFRVQRTIAKTRIEFDRLSSVREDYRREEKLTS